MLLYTNALLTWVKRSDRYCWNNFNPPSRSFRQHYYLSNGHLACTGSQNTIIWSVYTAIRSLQQRVQWSECGLESVWSLYSAGRSFQQRKPQGAQWTIKGHKRKHKAPKESVWSLYIAAWSVHNKENKAPENEEKRAPREQLRAHQKKRNRKSILVYCFDISVIESNFHICWLKRVCLFLIDTVGYSPSIIGYPVSPKRGQRLEEFHPSVYFT